MIRCFNGFYTDGENTGYGVGYAEGYEYGEEQGFNDGLTVGFENGEKAQYDEFWDTLQNNGNGANYYYAFAYGRFTDENFKPKYDIVGSTANNALQNAFYNAPITEINVSIIPNSYHIGGMFNGATKLKTIHKIVVSEDVTNYGLMFGKCYALENITFEGDICGDISLANSEKLTKASILNIIECLKNYGGTTTTKTLTLGTTNLANLTDAEKATATQKGWTLA